MGEQDELFQRRQGFWLRMARERAGKSQAGAAEVAGLSKSSKSSISDYENGITPIPQRILRRLANWYGVPPSVFTEPGRTAEELLDSRVRAASSLEQLDWDAAEEDNPKVEAEHAA